jgi:predicted nicotinamide N-methyase
MNIERLRRNIRRTLPDAQFAETPLHLCPELKLCLICADNMSRQFSEDEIRIILDNTPYWSFCWSSGQAMAYYLRQNRRLTEGRSILDFGSGSGVVAIAAAMAGAKKVVACDIDPDALDAIKFNSELNRVEIDTCESFEKLSDNFDMIITADFLYDKENQYFLEKFLSYAPLVFVAESRLKTIDVTPYEKITEITTTSLPDLYEPDEFKKVSIYRASNF